jgi:ribosome modulation factor
MKKKTSKAGYRGFVAFSKGRSAYASNQSLDANPYAKGQASAIAWAKGWLEGMKAHASASR